MPSVNMNRGVFTINLYICNNKMLRESNFMQGSKKHILFLSSWFPNRVKDTLGNFVERHAVASSLYNKVSVLYVCFDPQLKEKRYDVIVKNELNLNQIIIYIKEPTTRQAFIRNTARTILFLRAYFKGYKLIIKNFGQIDLIHENVIFPVGFIALIFKWVYHKKYIVTEHWTGFLNEDRNNIGFCKKIIGKCVVKNASALLTVTKDLGEAIIRKGMAKNYKVIENVVDVNLFVPNYNRVPEKFNFVHISTLDERQKNVFGLLRVVENLSKNKTDFALNIISDGRMDEYEQWCKERNLLNKVVFFLGKKHTSEVAEIMYNQDALILFSNYENFPCVIAESLACGIPVISTNVGGIAEHITKEMGLLVAPCDENNLGKAIVEMIENYQSLDKKYLRQYAVEHFSYEHVGKQFAEIYETILDK